MKITLTRKREKKYLEFNEPETMERIVGKLVKQGWMTKETT